ncbi:MAG TPA: hypothetical protein VNJ07_09465 [Chitinophagales bacterium]|nr:hypothetical protein [Chitinophagales bacterium]
MKFNGFEIQYSDKPVTPFGGLVVMKELLERTGILSQIQQCDIPENASPNGYDPMVVIQSFWYRYGAEHASFCRLNISVLMKRSRRYSDGRRYRAM